MIMSGSVEFLQRLLENSRVVKMDYDQDVFEVKLDVEKFEPSELSVKVKDEHLIVSGKHEKKSDEFGLVAQQFTRQFLMPEDINLDTLSSTLSPEGILTVRALVKGESSKQNANMDEDINVNQTKPKPGGEATDDQENMNNDGGNGGDVADDDASGVCCGAEGGGGDEANVNNNLNNNSNNNNNNNNISNNSSSSSSSSNNNNSIKVS